MPDETIDRMRLWVEQGVKEVQRSDGTIERSILTEEDCKNMQKVIAMLENPRPSRTSDDLVKLADAANERRLREKRTCEVFSWFALSAKDGTTRGFAGGMGSAESITGKKAQKIMERLRDMGAVRIDVFDPSQLEGAADELTADAFIITLPEDKGSRKNIFKWQRQFCRKQGFDPYRDLGQKYLLLKMS